MLRAWQQGEFELFVSASLLEELTLALAYPKLRRRISEEDADAVVQWLSEAAAAVSDPDAQPPVHSTDPGDEYLIALAAARQAILISADRDLLDLSDEIPVFSAATFLERFRD